MSNLTREIVLKSLKGYEIANAIHQKERLFHLQNISLSESIRVFESLFKDFGYIKGSSGGNSTLLEKRRIQAAVDLRNKFAEAYRRSSLGQ